MPKIDDMWYNKSVNREIIHFILRLMKRGNYNDGRIN